MKTNISVFDAILVLVIMLALDGIWLSLNKDMYKRMVKLIQGKDMELRWIGAVFAYLAIWLLIVLWAIPDIRAAKSPRETFMAVSKALLLGLCVYGVFNSTNLAMMSDYSLKVAVVDTLWGGALFAITAFIVGSFQLKK